MSKNEIEIEIETLQVAIGCNRAFMQSTRHGHDPKTRAQITADEARVTELRAALESA